MFARLRSHLTYANVAATSALILAVGGTSYAALEIPAHSIRGWQLRHGAVGTRELRNRGVHLIDIAPSTRRSLRGQRGPAGQPAAKYFAAVSSNGDFLRGNATHGSHTAVGSGIYTVGFAEPVTNCVYTATLGSTDGSAVVPGRVTVTPVSWGVWGH